MSRRLLELCLLVYPRSRRERDRAYLRDLALDLAERHGFVRQAVSLLMGGLRERIEVGRRRGVRAGTWIRRVAVASLALGALAFAANGLIGPAEGDGEQIQEEQFACVYRHDTASIRDPARPDGAGGCTGTRRQIAAKERGGWECTTHRRTRAGDYSTSWECTRRSVALASLGP